MFLRYETMLITAYPLLNPYRYPNTTYYHSRFSCCPDGWSALVAEFAENLSRLNLESFVLYEVNEKYNQLHIYAESETECYDSLDKLIHEIEERSKETCSRCGNLYFSRDHKCHGRVASSGAMEQWLSGCIEEMKV